MEERLLYHIWLSGPSGAPRLVETVLGLSRAKERFEEIAKQSPGRYYLWNVYDLQLIAKLDTAAEFRIGA